MRRQRPRDRARDAVGAWVTLVSSRPTAALRAVAILLILGVLGALRLSIDTDSSRMLSEDLPFRERENAVRNAFPGLDESLILVVRSDIADAADAAVLALSRALSKRDDVFGEVFAPAADPFLVSHALLYLGRDALDDRLARLGEAANVLAALRADQSLGGFLRAVDSATLLAERDGANATRLEPVYREAAAVFAAARQGQDRPFGWSGALDGTGGGPTLRLITLEPKLDFSALQPAKAALAAARDAIARLDPDLASAVQIGITGNQALRADEFRSVMETLPISMALSILLVAVLLRLALGSVARAGLALGTLSVTLVLTAGFAGVAVGSLNLVSIAFVVLMVGLGIDFAIHFIAHFDEHREEVSSRRVALVRTGRALGGALVLSATTTAVAFFAFATTDFVGMAQLGLIGGAGVLIALASALTVIPAAIAVWPRLDAGGVPGPLIQPPPRVRRMLPWLALAAGLAGLALAPWAHFDADPMNLRDPGAPSVQTFDWLADEPSLTPLRLDLIAANAEEARTTADRLDALPEVRQARWAGDLVPGEQAAKLDLIDLAYPSILHAVEGAPTDFAGSPRKVTAQSLAGRLAAMPGEGAAAFARELSAYGTRRTAALDGAMASKLFRYFPLLIDRLGRQLEAGPITLETLPETLRKRYVAPDGRFRVEVIPAADVSRPGPRAAFVEAVAAVAPGAGGPPDLIHGAAGAIGGAILQATLLALLGCTLLAWLMLRDLLRVGAILLPLVLAAGVTAGASVVLGLPFNYANVLVLPLLIGIGIDSGVHFALRGSRIAGSIFETSTPRAVLYSALTTIAAFGTLGLSGHRGIASMGILLAISVLAAVGMTFTLTPALIRTARRQLGVPISGP